MLVVKKLNRQLLTGKYKKKLEGYSLKSHTLTTRQAARYHDDPDGYSQRQVRNMLPTHKLEDRNLAPSPLVPQKNSSHSC